eukprot:COSAG01_NODE_4714_length_4796_cov_6.907813_5_plen_46_part_00
MYQRGECDHSSLPDFPNVHLQYKPGLVEEIERFGRENAPLSRVMP